MTTDQHTIDHENLKKDASRGVIAAIVIAVLTIIEFIIFEMVPNPLWPILPFVVAKGWIILDTFMHVRALWGDDH